MCFQELFACVGHNSRKMLPSNHTKGTPSSCHFVPNSEKLCSAQALLVKREIDKMHGQRNGRGAEADTRH